MNTHDAQQARIAELVDDLITKHERIEKLEAALRECVGHDRDPATLRDLARRFADNAPIVGADKGAAAEIIAEYGRSIRVARAALAKGQA